MTRGRLKVGIVGLGKMGRIRAEVVKSNPRLRLVAACDVVESMRDDFAGCEFFQNYRGLLAKRPEAVFVCTPNRYIPEIVVSALERGMHVFCEKPPGRDLGDVLKMQKAEKANPGLKLKFGFNHRYHEAVLDARSLVDSGRLGKIMWMRGVYGKAGGPLYDRNWRNSRNMAGGGILLDQGIHLLDLMAMFCGNFNEIHSFVSNSYWQTDVEDNVFAIMKNRAGQIASIHSSATQWQHRFLMEIYLQKGYITIDGILSSTRTYGPERLRVARCLYDRDGYPLPNPQETLTLYEEDDSWALEVDDFVKCIVQDVPVTIGSSRDAHRVMALVQRIYQADRNWMRYLREGGRAR